MENHFRLMFSMHINISLYQDNSELKLKNQFSLNGNRTPHKPKLI